tara:strand:+ start:13 stop:1329 length:1317 start_codon:yes stop_codon:yes gene_type:complete
MVKLYNHFKNQKILIYGFGKSGYSCFVNLNKENYLNIFDDYKKSLPNEKKKFYISRKELFKTNYDLIVVSPGIDLNKCSIKKYLKKNKSKIITELDIFYLKNQNNQKITITGTNGKSTTSKLLFDILKNCKKDVRLVGNIGNPILLEKNIKKKTIFVIEASSYQIDYSRYFKSDYSVILNIYPDHLERHKTFKNYIKAKFKLIKNQNNNCYAYVNQNDKYTLKEIKNYNLKNKIIKVKNFTPKKILDKIKNPYFKNINNQSNLNFVIEICKNLKINNNKILKVVNSFKALKYRQEIIYKNNHLLIMNDSKSTSFSSSLNILQSYKNIFWIVGGKFKKGDKFNLKDKYYKNINAYIYGKNKNFFINSFKNKIKFKLFKNIREVLLEVIKDFKKINNVTQNVIFSPSAASFDQFNNFEDRGKYFNFLIKKLNFIKKINEK